MNTTPREKFLQAECDRMVDVVTAAREAADLMRFRSPGKAIRVRDLQALDSLHVAIHRLDRGRATSHGIKAKGARRGK